jgi:hypothetical protein
VDYDVFIGQASALQSMHFVHRRPHFVQGCTQLLLWAQENRLLVWILDAGLRFW